MLAVEKVVHKSSAATASRAPDARAGKSLGQAQALVIGRAYKKNVDVRESPTFELMEPLEKRGAAVGFHDPHVAKIPPTREHAAFAGRRSTPLIRETITGFDAELTSTDHDDVDHALVAGNGQGPLIVDTRNAFAVSPDPHLIKA